MNDRRPISLRWWSCNECRGTHGTVPAPASSGCATAATVCFAIVAAVVALVFCSLAPAWATDVAESAPERISPEVLARLRRISAEEFCWLNPAWATDGAEYAPEKLLADVRACLRRAGTFSPHAPRRTLSRDALDTGLISGEEAFKLWNDCRPIAFSVHLQGKNEASKIGLTKEAIETAVRSRLRGARIFRDNPDLRSQLPTRERRYGFLIGRIL